MTNRISLRLRSVLVLVLLAGFGATPAAAFEPGKVTCIIPSDPGGGWDFTCHELGRCLHALGLITEPVEIVHLPGDAGRAAFAHVVEERADDPNLIIAASSFTTTRLALGDYGEHNPRHVRWPGALGADFAVVAVAPGSPLLSLDAFVAGLRAGDLVVTGGGSTPFKLREFAQAVGIGEIDAGVLDYRDFGTGDLEARIGLLEGEADVYLGNISEILPALESGDARALAILSSHRLPGTLETIPTAMELGYPSIIANWRGIYLPGKISSDAFAFWSEAIADVYASPAWQRIMAENGLMPFPMTGHAMETFVQRQAAGVRQMVR